MRTLVLLAVLAATAGCGPAGAVVGRGEITDDDRARGGTLADLLQSRFPELTVVPGEYGAIVRIRRTGTVPLVYVDEFRRGMEALTQVLVADVVRVEVLTRMADTLIYGREAAEVGVLRVTTRLGDGDPGTE